ncbi:MAG: hypothetical protein LBE71_01855 [Dysgonamonadaceae bacterium]|jgi:glycosyltransferase involved in cell wall biosynthesis|nr:hypothetical protein [Dysgonamonadaceae bacterium]
MDRTMKNVLIVCDAFPPAFNPRMGYLCKYLLEYGWNPIVITEYSPQNFYNDLAKGINVTRINYYWSKNNTLQKLKYAFVFLAELIMDYKHRAAKKKATVIVEKHGISLVLSSSSCRTYPAIAACQLAHRYNVPFVVDLRDIIEQFPNNEHISKQLPGIASFLNNALATVITKRFIRQRDKVLVKADAVTTVSSWHRETLSQYNKYVDLIFNGFDPDLFYPQTIQNDRFIITYTGRIESIELKDPSLLFAAVVDLSARKLINPETFRIRFYLTNEISKNIISALIQQYSVAEFTDCFDTVQNIELPKILNESSVLLLLTNKSSGAKCPKGIMGTKIFEYLAVEKPILCVRNDEACMEETINSARAGLAAATLKEVEHFIMEKYAEWQQHKYTRQQVNRPFIQQFSRKYQAGQFATLFQSLVNDCRVVHR